MFNTMNTKEHYKMYKKGKTWIFAGIVTATLALGAFGGQTAHADTVAGETPAASETTIGDAAASAKEVTLTPGETPAPSTTGATDNDGTKDATTGTPATDKVTPAKDSTDTATPDTKAAENNETQEKPATDPKPVTDSQSPAPVTTPKTPTQQPAAKQVTPDEQTTGNGSVIKKVNKLVLPKRKKNVASRSNLLRAELPATPAVTVAQPVAEAEESIDQWMPNTKLQAEVLRTLNNISPEGKTWASASDITQSDMLYLTGLTNKETTWIDDSTPYSLEGLQYATNLSRLTLMGLPQRGEGPIYGGITDISPLSGLTKLTYLDLSFNSVSDISPIANLKNITFLQLHYNKISDFSSLTPSQYTEGFTYQNQLAVLPLVYVSNVSRTADMPFKAYLPGGTLAQLVEGNPGTFIENYYETPTTEIYSMYLRGGDGVSDNNGGLTFTNLVNNGYQNLTEFEGIPIVPNQLVYYMVGKYLKADGENFITVVQPYMIGNDAAPVTVHYVDEQGKALQADSTVNGVVGNTYSIDAPTITGYEPATPANATGTFSDNAQTVTFVYKEATSSVTVHYQDETGATIKPDTVSSGKVGTAYDIAHPDITGYTYKATQGDAQGTYAATPAEVTFVYTKNSTVTPPVVTPTQTITVTVHYQTADGTAVAPDVTVTGKVGDAYTTSPAANVPAGYKLVTTPSNASGTLGDSDFTVIYVYAKTGGDGDKVVVKPTTPTKPTTKPSVKPAKKTPAKKVQKSGQADTVTGVKQTPVATKGGSAATVNLAAKTGEPAVVPTAVASKTTLPQTNETTTSPLWGLAVLGTILGLVGIKFKKEK
ncbi:MucBP domain-containing protein [Levilactobacillus cerevisiae]|uniref:MucBP domain-containing protein n=1 Tax=Levilactobacillus cerevisiae TaxID=1704076 RepID=UPI000F7BA435|nr:MucBP domain-containing protein [Levilactobacillus cerevisiae]